MHIIILLGAPNFFISIFYPSLPNSTNSGVKAGKQGHNAEEQRCLMKEAMYAGRHHQTATHCDYCRSLRLTNFVLSTFVADEPLFVPDHTPVVFLNNPLHHKTTTPHHTPLSPSPPPPPYNPFLFAAENHPHQTPQL